LIAIKRNLLQISCGRSGPAHGRSYINAKLHQYVSVGHRRHVGAPLAARARAALKLAGREPRRPRPRRDSLSFVIIQTIYYIIRIIYKRRLASSD
jgi:hypothetical protein